MSMQNKRARELGHEIPTAGTLDQLSYCTKCGDPFTTERVCPGTREFDDPLHQLAHEFVDADCDCRDAEAVTRRLHALLIQVHNDALDDLASRFNKSWSGHLDVARMKYPPP